MSDAEKLAALNEQIAELTTATEKLKKALGDPKISAWIADRGRVAPRALTSFEMATVKRIDANTKQLRKLTADRDRLLEDVVCVVARKRGEGLDDPEVLLRASMLSLNRLHKGGHATPETRAVTQALLRYLKSLDDD